MSLVGLTSASLPDESFPCPSPPEALHSEYLEVDYTPTARRFDAPKVAAGLKLETRGTTPQAQQRKFIFDGEAIKETIIAKLRSRGATEFSKPLEDCHTTQWRKQCTSCRSVQIYYNRCEVFYCPICAPRLARDRRKSIEWWTERIDQPKHVVVTVRNVDTISREYVQWFKECWQKLRRRKIAKWWNGGFYSFEITNENKGWHLHCHALIDARWIDAGELAREWANIVGQDFAIVKVKDARRGDYLKELTKYVCDGQQLAKWEPFQIEEFIRAFKGVRTFGVFGKLYKLRADHRAFLDEVQADKDTCKCGCNQFRFFDPNEWEYYEAMSGPAPPVIIPRVTVDTHPELPL